MICRSMERGYAVGRCDRGGQKMMDMRTKAKKKAKETEDSELCLATSVTSDAHSW